MAPPPGRSMRQSTTPATSASSTTPDRSPGSSRPRPGGDRGRALVAVLGASNYTTPRRPAPADPRLAREPSAGLPVLWRVTTPWSVTSSRAASPSVPVRDGLQRTYEEFRSLRHRDPARAAAHPGTSQNRSRGANRRALDPRPLRHETSSPRRPQRAHRRAPRGAQCPPDAPVPRQPHELFARPTTRPPPAPAEPFVYGEWKITPGHIDYTSSCAGITTRPVCARARAGRWAADRDDRRDLPSGQRGRPRPHAVRGRHTTDPAHMPLAHQRTGVDALAAHHMGSDHRPADRALVRRSSRIVRIPSRATARASAAAAQQRYARIGWSGLRPRRTVGARSYRHVDSCSSTSRSPRRAGGVSATHPDPAHAHLRDGHYQ